MKIDDKQHHRVIGESFIINASQRIGQCPVCGEKIRSFTEAIAHTFKFFRRSKCLS